MFNGITHAKPYDLRQAFLFGVFLPVAVLSAGVVLVMVGWAERTLESRLQGEIELISRAVAPDISVNLAHGDDQEIRRSLDSLFSIRRVYGAAVYDERGDLVVAAGTADPDVRSSAAASGVVRTGEDDGRYRKVDGRNVYAYFSPLLDHGGRIHGLLQITRDRREIESALGEVRTLAWSVWVFAVVLSVVITLLLYRRLVGRHVQTLLQRMGALARGDRDVSFNAASPREFSEIARGFNGMVQAIRTAESELRERQQRERQLERKLQEAERTAVVGRVAQGLAHELASPLSVIAGRVRRMERWDSTGRFGPLLKDVQRQVVRMTGIVRQVLNYGVPQSRSPTEVSLSKLLERASRVDWGERVEVRLNPAMTDVTIRGDTVRLELAVSNLLSNAVRHARTRVDVGVHRDGDGWIVLYVEDDGPGVAPEDVMHVFQPFFTRQPSGSGTGLGLAIVANAMREHQGEARYESPAAGGARFVLRFPESPAGAGDE